MADTAIWSTLSWPLANVVSARALIYDLVGIVPAFGPCFACSCDQKVRARLFVSSHRYFYKVAVARRAARRCGVCVDGRSVQEIMGNVV